MKKSATLKCALLVAGLAVFGCSANNGTAYDTTTTTTQPVATSSDHTADVALSDKEQQFVALLVRHGQIGVDLAEQGRKQGSQEVKNIAARVLHEDSQQVQLLSRLQVADTGNYSAGYGTAVPSRENSSYSSGNMASGQREVASSGDTSMVGQTASPWSSDEQNQSGILNTDNRDQSNVANRDDASMTQNMASESAGANGLADNGPGSSLGAGLTDGPVGLNHSSKTDSNSGVVNNHDVSGVQYDGPRTVSELNNETDTSMGYNVNGDTTDTNLNATNNVDVGANADLASADLGPTSVIDGSGSFDQRWKKTMIQHEQAGIALIRQFRDELKSERLRDVADRVIDDRQAIVADLESIAPAVGQEPDE